MKTSFSRFLSTVDVLHSESHVLQEPVQLFQIFDESVFVRQFVHYKDMGIEALKMLICWNGDDDPLCCQFLDFLLKSHCFFGFLQQMSKKEGLRGRG